jgi:cytochrome c-type biogenesis protein CcmF
MRERERYAFEVQVEKDGRSHVIAPIMFTSSYSEGIMKNPDIAKYFTRDLYLAPLSLEDNSGNDLGQVSLREGESGRVGPVTVTMRGFDFPDDQKAGMMEGREAKIGVKLKVQSPEYGTVEIIPAKVVGGGGGKDIPARLGETYEFTVLRMGQSGSDGKFSVDIGVRETKAAKGPEVLMVEASVKPFISFVWAGVIVMLVGFMITIVRRSIEARLATPNDSV